MGFDGNDILEREKRIVDQKLKQEAVEEKKRRENLPWWFVALTFGFIALFIFYKIGLNEPVSSRAKETSTVSNGEQFISEQEFGNKWPFTIPSGTLSCLSNNINGYEKQFVAISYNGKTWAVNGSARGRDSYRPLEEIWKDNPDTPGAKFSMGEVIQKGLKLCGK